MYLQALWEASSALGWPLYKKERERGHSKRRHTWGRDERHLCRKGWSLAGARVSVKRRAPVAVGPRPRTFRRRVSPRRECRRGAVLAALRRVACASARCVRACVESHRTPNVDYAMAVLSCIASRVLRARARSARTLFNIRLFMTLTLEQYPIMTGALSGTVSVHVHIVLGARRLRPDSTLFL